MSEMTPSTGSRSQHAAAPSDAVRRFDHVVAFRLQLRAQQPAGCRDVVDDQQLHWIPCLREQLRDLLGRSRVSIGLVM